MAHKVYLKDGHDIQKNGWDYVTIRDVWVELGKKVDVEYKHTSGFLWWKKIEIEKDTERRYMDFFRAENVERIEVVPEVEALNE